MKSLTFTNVDSSCNVEYKVDLIGSNTGLFTVLEIKGLDSSAQRAGLDFANLEYSIEEFKQFATDNNLKLVLSTQESSSVLVALGTALNITTTGFPDGVTSDAEATDITCIGDTTDSLNGDYFTFNTPTVSYYVWYKTSGGVETDPAVANRTGVKVTVTTNDTAATVAAATRAALAAVTTVTITGATTHVIITNNAKNSVTDAAVGTSGFTISVTNQGTTAVAYYQAYEAEGGNAPYSWEVTTGTLPAGLELNPNTGVLQGYPTTVGSSTFTVTVTDAFGVTDTFEDTIAIAAS